MIDIPMQSHSFSATNPFYWCLLDVLVMMVKRFTWALPKSENEP
jgi:hypothetical protein